MGHPALVFQKKHDSRTAMPCLQFAAHLYPLVFGLSLPPAATGKDDGIYSPVALHIGTVRLNFDSSATAKQTPLQNAASETAILSY